MLAHLETSKKTNKSNQTKPRKGHKKGKNKMILTIESRRRDGKFKVVMSWAGQPNAFGGLTFAKSIRKLIDEARLESEIAQAKEVYDPCNIIPQKYKITEKNR
jgi:hypothetical protein